MATSKAVPKVVGITNTPTDVETQPAEAKKAAYTQVYNVTLKDKRLNSAALHVYLILLSHSWLDKKTGKYPENIWPSLSKMSEESSISVSTVQRCLKVLEDTGYITPIRVGKRANNRYILSQHMAENSATIEEWKKTIEVNGQIDQSPIVKLTNHYGQNDQSNSKKTQGRIPMEIYSGGEAARQTAIQQKEERAKAAKRPSIDSDSKGLVLFELDSDKREREREEKLYSRTPELSSRVSTLASSIGLGELEDALRACPGDGDKFIAFFKAMWSKLHGEKDYSLGIAKQYQFTPEVEQVNFRDMWNEAEEHTDGPWDPAWDNFVDKIAEFFESNTTKTTDQSFRNFRAFWTHYGEGKHTKAEKRANKVKEKERMGLKLKRREEEKAQEQKTILEDIELAELWSKYPARYPKPLKKWYSHVEHDPRGKILCKSNVYAFE